jgi:hypothetical protein
MLTDVHKPPAEGTFYDEHGKAQKLVIAEVYSWHDLH